MYKKILITGSTGSIGSLMPKKNYIIPIFSRLENTEKEIYDEVSKHDADVIIHLASLTDKKKCENNKLKCYHTNVLGSQKIYSVAKKAKIKRFIFVSSSDVYEPTNKIKLINTSHNKKPDSYYSKCKLLTESRLVELSNNKVTKLSIARVFNTFSKKIRKGSLEEKVHNLAKFKKIEFIEDLNKVRDIISSKEVCNQLIKLSNSTKFPQFVNICSSKPTLLFDYVNKIYKKYNINFKKLYPYDIPLEKNIIVGKKTIF